MPLANHHAGQNDSNIENLLALQEVTEFTYNAQRDGDADKAERVQPRRTSQNITGINQR